MYAISFHLKSFTLPVPDVLPIVPRLTLAGRRVLCFSEKLCGIASTTCGWWPILLCLAIATERYLCLRNEILETLLASPPIKIKITRCCATMPINRFCADYPIQ
ncbi:ORF_106L [Scale drop disease virus]|uniref:ORF_106L n=1 Tax=Scale drop disease virus TaxID=1697349 RepID=A0A0K1L6B7_9VIRU|nr:ORF_106L [Scale drop disease virus]AKU37521.1 ORF_106L [Scale drop disease virus]